MEEFSEEFLEALQFAIELHVSALHIYAMPEMLSNGFSGIVHFFPGPAQPPSCTHKTL